ncbi:MAG TPA: DUF2157 domain-containing protein [Euzebya sp.]|nr:DUF2157 domain-containing protein [Euzebya sp.]
MVLEFDRHLTTWVDEGLISPEQAAAIRHHESTATRPSGVSSATERSGGRSSVLAEAVGYLGAVLTLVAGGLLLNEFWEQITAWGRLALTTVLTLVVFAAGWTLRKRPQPAIQRLTSVLWFATSVGVAFVVGLAGDQAARPDRDLALAVALAVAVVSALLYQRRQSPLQLLAFSGGVVATAMAALAYPQAEVDSFFFGLLLWALGVAWFLLATGGWLRPARTAQVLGLLAIGVGCQVGSFGDVTRVAVVLALVSAAVLLWLSVAGGDTVVLSFAMAGVFVFLPQAVFTFFGDSVGAPLALLITGLLLVGAAVALVTLRREIAADQPVQP